MRTHLTAISCARPLDQRGLSLVELMISMTIGLLLLLGISQLIVQQNSTRNELEKSSRQIENGRYATQLLQDDIQLAGYYATFNPPGNTTYTTPAPCGSGMLLSQDWVPGLLSQVPVPIYGYPGANVAPLTCLDHYQPNTAVLVIRHMGTTTAAQGSAQDSQLMPGLADGTSTYFQVSHCATELTTPFVAAINTSAFNLHDKDCKTTANISKYYVRIYYISSCDVCGSDTIPTLKMVENNGNPVPVVEGIENMQFDYGLDNLPAAPAAPDGYPDTWKTTDNMAATDWVNAMAVRINLLARNNESTAGYTDAKTYCLTGAPPLTNGIPNACLPGSPASNQYVPPPNNSYKRHLYSELVRAINPIGRRANP